METAHGDILTPVFMPVGTAGSVKALSPDDLHATGAQIILGNTYHLYLRPGTDIIHQGGGLHQFIHWDKPMLTDSGGYQVFSLGELNQINMDSVTFRSHLDGSLHTLSPEISILIQRELGADICMAFDECTPWPATQTEVQESLKRTHAWEKASLKAFRQGAPLYDHRQHLFGIVQGGTYPELRRASAAVITALDFDGFAIGGLSVGEPKSAMFEMTELVTELLPENQPRYLMGVGKPEDLVEAVSLGVDMFDCVLPTRNARHGILFTWDGPLVVKAGRHKADFQPVSESCRCYTCQNFSRAYLRHLFNANEVLVLRLASLHNIHFYQELMAAMRTAILDDNFVEWKRQFLSRYHDIPVEVDS
ncbi:MAG: tRNA guanosine(34) transglycosylase Tgt [Lentisphaeria bacterium]|nr:tRNA guanosine(34) transglycosylase Tgt [Candidatus Neomarinimicrobiota bacterium]MCF7842199.1 tRNA guanosine(34) transglycosylase Tgt [Lentisphaeria bacterium]